MSATVLEREMFSEAEAARLLRVAQSTLHYWLEGGERRGKVYKPVIREARRDARAVTWAEFIEAGLLRQYRRDHRVPMPMMRDFIDRLREEFGVPYPLAHERPFVAGRELVRRAQESTGLDADFCLVAEASGQLILTPASDAFIKRVEWADDIAAAWRPHNDPDSPVLMRPGQRFGRPAINGVATEAIWEHADADESEAEIVEAFGLTIADVRYALSYETSARSKPAARAA